MSGRHTDGSGIVWKAPFGAPHERRAVVVGEGEATPKGRLTSGVPSAVAGDELATALPRLRVPGIRTNCPDDSGSHTCSEVSRRREPEQSRCRPDLVRSEEHTSELQSRGQ